MEYWYDIYALLEEREVISIEAFLCHFADRGKIDPRKRNIITLIPNVPISEIHTLFRDRYADLNIFEEETRNLVPNRSSFQKPEMVQVDTLSEAIQVGLSKRNQAFTLYIRNYTRKDLKCLLIHFTLDNKVVLGISIAEKDEQGQDNLPLAEKIMEEMKAIVPAKASSIMFEQRPPDSEVEFYSMKESYEKMDDSKKVNGRGRFDTGSNLMCRAYYLIYRDELHRNFREVKGKVIYTPNNSKYFTIGDKQGHIINVIKSHGNFPDSRKVKNPKANDVAQLPFLGYLLDRSSNKDFVPACIHKVSFHPEKIEERVWIGHRDSVSDVTFYKGLRTGIVGILDTYYLDNIDDVKRLAEEGFFKFQETLINESGIEAYENWIINHRQTALYLALLQDEELAWEPRATTLLELFGKENWQQFISYLNQFKIDEEKLKELLTEMCRSDIWHNWQIKQIFEIANLTREETKKLLNDLARNYRFELFHEIFSTRVKPISLSNLIRAIKEGIDKRDSPEVLKFIHFYLQMIEREYITFCDYPLILTLAALEDHQELLQMVLKLLPPENWHSNQLLNIALATENTYILDQLTFTQAEIDNIRKEEEACIQDTEEDLTQLIKKTTREGNYFQVSYLVPRLVPKDLITPMLDASKEGMIGIVKVLVEHGNVAPDCWFNFPAKFANKGGFQKMKEYLLSKGVKDEVFT